MRERDAPGTRAGARRADVAHDRTRRAGRPGLGGAGRARGNSAAGSPAPAPSGRPARRSSATAPSTTRSGTRSTMVADPGRNLRPRAALRQAEAAAGTAPSRCCARPTRHRPTRPDELRHRLVRPRLRAGRDRGPAGAARPGVERPAARPSRAGRPEAAAPGRRWRCDELPPARRDRDLPRPLRPPRHGDRARR